MGNPEKWHCRVLKMEMKTNFFSFSLVIQTQYEGHLHCLWLAKHLAYRFRKTNFPLIKLQFFSH